jgi:hypothetical protein
VGTGQRPIAVVARILRRPSPTAWAAGGVFAFALAVRIAWVNYVDSPYNTIFSDMGGYVNRALHAAYGTGDAPRIFATFYSPGTHLILAAQMRLVGFLHHAPFLLLHCTWGAVVAPCATLLALRIVPRLSVAVALGVVVAVWDPLLSFTGFFSSEQPDAGLLAVSTWLLVRVIEERRGAIALGITAALAYLVRSQIALTIAGLGALWLLGTVLRRSWARPPPATLFVTGVIVVSAVVFGASRYHALSGRWGLICDDEAVGRLFADTDYGVVRARMSQREHGVEGEFFFGPPSKGQSGEHRELHFDGYLGDPEILDRARRLEVARMTAGERVSRFLSNISLLFVNNDLWPENTQLSGRRWRSMTIDASKDVLLAIVCPLALLGLVSCFRKPTAVLVVIAAHVLTALVTAGFFYGEARYRVPYDVFLLLLALEGARAWAPKVTGWLSPPSPAAAT